MDVFVLPLYKMRYDNQNAINQLTQEVLEGEKEVIISGNDIINVDILSKLTMVEILTISCIKITELQIETPATIKNIKLSSYWSLSNTNHLNKRFQIEQINISDLNIASIAVFRNFQQLKKITIYKRYQIIDYDVLQCYIGLNFLCICDTNFSAIQFIANLQNPETLKLQDNKQQLNQFLNDIRNNQQQVQKFLNEYKQTQQYKDYYVISQMQLLKKENENITKQLQQQEQQRQLDIQNQVTQIQQINQQYQIINQQLQQMQHLMQQITEQMNQLQQQIQINQTNQDKKNHFINKALQQVTFQYTDNYTKIQKQFANFIDSIENNL